jgi:hypothetical protein
MVDSRWDHDKSLRFDVVLGLRKGFKMVPGLRGEVPPEREELVAQEVIDHLKLSRWKIEKIEPPPLGPGAAAWGNEDLKS